MGHPLDDLDSVVHALQHTGVQPVPSTEQDPLQIGSQFPGETIQSLSTAADGHLVPLLPGVSGGGLVTGKPEGLELILE